MSDEVHIVADYMQRAMGDGQGLQEAAWKATETYRLSGGVESALEYWNTWYGHGNAPVIIEGSPGRSSNVPSRH